MANRSHPRRRWGYASRRSYWRGPLPVIGSLAVIVVVIGGFIALSRGQPAPSAPSDVAPIVSAATGVPAATFEAVGSGGLRQPLAPTGGTLLRAASGKPLVIYVGADYCPFCASERWSLVAALSRFGTFQGLSLTRSSSTDVYPNTATFSFRGSSYASGVIELSSTETADREGKAVDQPNAVQKASLDRYDPRGSIPYVSIADRYTETGSGYSPDILAGRSYEEIAAALKDPSSPIARAILGNANYVTAAICAVTDDKPTAVCGSPAIRSLKPAR